MAVAPRASSFAPTDIRSDDMKQFVSGMYVWHEESGVSSIFFVQGGTAKSGFFSWLLHTSNAKQRCVAGPSTVCTCSSYDRRRNNRSVAF